MDGIDRTRPEWNDYFISQALLASQRSHDVHTKVGAVLVDQSHNLVTTGYNGFVPNAPDEILPLHRPDKYIWLNHAEKSVLLSCLRQGKTTNNCTLYVSAPPCWSCFYDILGTGIFGIYYIAHPNIKTQAFNQTLEWNIHQSWIKSRIFIQELSLGNLPLSQKIVETIFPKVYNK